MSDTHSTDMQKDPSRKSLAGYVTGLILCLVLTLLSFGLVAVHLKGGVDAHEMSNAGLFVTILILALIQLFVQVTCFLRLNASKEGRWDLMPFLFTIFIVCVVVGGSMWIMHNLNYNMMH